MAALLRACGAEPPAAQEHAPEAAVVEAAPEAPVHPLLTADGYGVAYAYTPRQGPSSNGTYHLVVQAPLQAGRLRREPGDALCKPARRFWGLDGGRTEADFDSRPCATCSTLRGRIVAT